MRTLTEALAELADKQGWVEELRTAAGGHDEADIEAMDRVEHRGGKIQSWRNPEPAGSRRFEKGLKT